METTAGKSEGIGINIINTTATISGVEYKVIRVINVSKDSPAEAAGMLTGDLIYAVGDVKNDPSGAVTVQELGYDMALKKLQGESGSVAVFTVLRPKDGGYEMLDAFHITRSPITTSSVYYHRFADSNVGIVKIVQFDLTTPKQFSNAVDSLRQAGCDRFVFDVRYNPGGDLRSIAAVLSYFLSEGDVLIRTKNKAGDESISKVEEVTYSGDYTDCSVSKADIGKYRGLKSVVLCNQNTASAAELFTATFRDYALGTTVGVTTFGKGSMQSILPLSYYGYGGALKLTTAMYYSAKDLNGYDGIGITPDVVIELSEEAAKQGIYEIADKDDNQLMKAIEELNK